ncbi:MAG: rod shape-determining protein [Clostridia bacterium]|nr:rod shape-determining protein [Clostridia bacterium]
MSSNSVCIDLGSSKTTIYQNGSGIVLCEPSVVALTREEHRRLKEVGTPAKKLLGRVADNSEVVRPIFEALVEDGFSAVKMTEAFLNKITVRRLSARPRVLLNVPCGVDTTAIRRFERVLKDADVTDYDFVESPILTALGLGIQLTSSPSFIIDIGGGVTEIAAVSSDGIICGLSVNMGGISIDKMLKYYVEEAFNLRIGDLSAEKLKLSIGSLYGDDELNAIVDGSDLYTGRPRAESLIGKDILKPITAFFDKIFQITGMVLAKLPAEVSADIRRAGVYISGGVSKMVGLEEYFYEKMGMRANIAENGEFAVANGGGVLLSDKKMLEKYRIDVK